MCIQRQLFRCCSSTSYSQYLPLVPLSTYYKDGAISNQTTYPTSIVTTIVERDYQSNPSTLPFHRISSLQKKHLSCLRGAGYPPSDAPRRPGLHWQELNDNPATRVVVHLYLGWQLDYHWIHQMLLSCIEPMLSWSPTQISQTIASDSSINCHNVDIVTNSQEECWSMAWISNEEKCSEVHTDIET